MPNSVRNAVLVLLASGPALASASTLIGSANASLQGLQWQLIDLTPRDGIAPGLTVDGKTRFKYPSAGDYGVDQPIDIPVSPLPLSGQYLGGSSPEGTGGVIAPDTLSVKAGQLGLYPDTWFTGGYAQSISYMATDGSPGARITLAPHSRLVLTGTADLYAMANLTLSGFGAMGYQSGEASVHAAFLAPDMAGVAGSAWDAALKVEQFKPANMQPNFLGDPPQFIQGKAFELSFSNATDHVVEGRLMLDLNVALISAVPEPGTWLLMALGLMAMTAVRQLGADRQFEI